VQGISNHKSAHLMRQRVPSVTATTVAALGLPDGVGVAVGVAGEVEVLAGKRRDSARV